MTPANGKSEGLIKADAVSGTVASALCESGHFIFILIVTLEMRTAIVPILQMRKQRLREVKGLTQRYI